MSVRILVGDCLAELRKQTSNSVHCCVTSPPYWGLRDYGIEPTIWGGDEACEHEWGDPIRKHNANGIQGPGSRGKNVDYAGFDRGKFTGPFCAKCDAWRGAFGLEPTPDLYIDHLVMIFDEVRRVLRPDGTLWLNLGDSYATGAGKVGDHPGGGEQGERWKGGPPSDSSTLRGNGHIGGGPKLKSLDPVPRGRPAPGATSMAGEGKRRANRDGTHAGKHTGMTSIGPMTQPNRMPIAGLKPKDLVGIPWMAAFALRRAGWWLRQDIIWNKPNPMPESVMDRCTKAHEYLFLLSKSERYYFDQESILEQASSAEEIKWSDNQGGIHSGEAHIGERTKVFRVRGSGNKERKPSSERGTPQGTGKNQASSVPWSDIKRNKRSVWTVTTQPFKEAHFATFPPALIEPCILAGCPSRGIVLDPFGGAGTTGLVADRLQRSALLIELNPTYADMARRRIDGDAPLFSRAAE